MRLPKGEQDYKHMHSGKGFERGGGKTLGYHCSAMWVSDRDA
jgi:hypothetical protein